MNQYLKLFSVILLLLINQAAVSQQLQQAFLESYSSTGTQEMFYKTSVIRGADGFIYVCGATLNLEGNYDMLITKMTSLNLVVWTKQYAGLAAGDDFAADIVQDGAGNIIITGTEYISSTNYNAVTIKYNSSGALQWVKSYNGAGNSFDGGMSVVRDVSNNIYICGGSYGTTTLSDFLCIKYNSDGVEQWANTWNSTGLQDISSRLAVSATQVSVIGASQQSSTDWKMATTFFNVNTGVFLGAKLTGGDDEGIDKVADLTIDGDDNTYVVGAVRNINKAYDIKVIKLSPTYTVLWQQTYNGPANLNDEGLALELTSTNDLVICGYTTNIGEDKNLITTKYAGSNGALIWSKTYDEQNGEDRATDLKLDLNGNAIICGSSFKDGNLDYVVQKLKSSNGDLIWANRWNSDNNSDDMPMSIAIDENNNVVYVAGQSSDGNGSYTYNVTRWIQKEVYMPMPIDGFSSSSGYIQNKKQLRNEDGSANASVKFYSQQKGPATYVDDDKISYVFYTPAADTLETDTIHRVDMKFNKGNTHAPVYPISERAEYANFYLGHMPEKAERTRIFNAVVKLNAYNNTDIIYDNNNCGYRHWIVARNGAPIGDFEMEYTGLTSLSLDVNGNLVIETSIGNQVQLKANAYSMNNASGMLTILPWQPDYYINGNKVTFSNIGSWNGTLVFEMKQAAGGGNSPIENAELEWSTYFGGAGKDFLCDVVAEANGRSWTVGSSTSIVFPLIPGIAVLNNLNAESDAIITSFQPNCSINWLTYYGGSLDDIATAIALTDIGWPVVVGYTESEDLPDEADGNLDDSTLGGIKDGFIVRLFPNGFIMLDSYIGGDGDDVIGDVGFNEIPGTKDIYLVGSTNSDETTLPLISPAGAYNQPYAGTDPVNLNGDGFIMRINEANNQPIWRTFFGTKNGDFCYRLSFAVNDLFVVGNTTCQGYSEDACDVPTDGLLPHCITNGSWENLAFENANGFNYFIARFDKNTNSLDWCTITGPSVQSYTTGFYESVDLASQTPSASSFYMSGVIPQFDDEVFPFTTSAFEGSYNQQQTFNGSAFLMRFRVEEGFNNLLWATAIDGQGYQEGATVSVSNDGSVYLAGDGSMLVPQEVSDWCTLPQDNMFPICNESGASFMETNVSSPPYRSFICAFNSNDQMIWSTFFGNHFRNEIYSSACAGNYIFLCGKADYPETAEDTWTLQEFDNASELDYFQDIHGGESDGCITRFMRTLLTGVDEVEFDSQFGILLFPVPACEMLNIALPSEFVNGSHITVIDNIGRTVYSTAANSGITSLDVSELPSGGYLVRVTHNQGVLTKSFVKE